MLKKLFVTVLSFTLMLGVFASNCSVVFAQGKQKVNISVLGAQTNDLYKTLVNNYLNYREYAQRNLSVFFVGRYFGIVLCVSLKI